MNIKSYPLQRGQWYPDKVQKQYVVWHGTAGRTRYTPVNSRPGRATTSIDGWNLDPTRVGAPYLVDRDGSIYQTFDDAEWIYHLGLKGTNGYYDRASVAIEFANELALQFDGNQLHAFGHGSWSDRRSSRPRSSAGSRMTWKGRRRRDRCRGGGRCRG